MRKKRKILSGIVKKISGNKTIKVECLYKKQHKKYKKEIKHKTVVFAHDEENKALLGKTVYIMATRPLSKIKHFRLIKILN